jgi:OOP family OmpA-OmpF porin
LYDGISPEVPEVDYERIENIVKKHIPEVVETQVVVKEPMEQKWVLVGVNFDFNKATLKSESYPILFHAVQVLLMNPDMRVEIQGHTDNIGSEDYNMKLGEKRAQSVKDYLVARGISADRLTTRSFGESQPIADNKTASGREMNRRVEFKVLN